MPKKLSDLSKSVRQQKIYNILRHLTDEECALTVTEIHNRLVKDDVDTCHRTIKRDLEEMSLTHKFVSTETTPVRFYCSDEYEPDYQLTFNESELKTMALALRALREVSDSFQKSLCEKTETILLSKLPKEIAIDFERLKSYTIVSPGIRTTAGLENNESYKQVLTALKLEKVIECENHSPYKSASYRTTLRTYSPIKLNLVGGEQYLIVKDHSDQEIKRLKICRMKNVKILDQKIDKDTYLEIEKLTHSEDLQKYVIHCDELMFTLFKEKKIHPSQRTSEENGSFTITFQATPSIEISRYLSGWAKHIKQIEPPEVMEEIKDIWSTGLKLVA